MATVIELPQFGNTVEECIITRWVKQKGDAVTAGDLVAEIETDKTTFEITAPVDGTLLETFFGEGALVPVFTNLCVIGNVGESVESFRPGGGGSSDPPSAPSVLSPRARKYATARGFEPGPIAGSGPHGRVLEKDVHRAYSSSNTRKVIARRMRESLASTAQYTMHASASAAGLLAVRARAKASRTIASVNINDLVAYCTIHALGETPALNAEYNNGEIVAHSDIHLGFACDTPHGLVVPVVRNAHTLSLGDLASRMKALATQAVDGNIAPDDLSGATFTISNLGALGIEAFTPVINPPQVAILGVGAIQLKPVRTGGTIDFVDTIGLSLTCDHQVIDGAPGARFLRTLAAKIESVESLVSDVLRS